MRKPLLALSPAKAKLQVEGILKIYELFVYRIIHYIANLFSKNLLKIETP